MDQTPFFFEANCERTLEETGEKTVSLKKRSSYADYRITAALCVSASGGKLTPYLIYKGKKGARVTIEVTAQDFRFHCLQRLQFLLLLILRHG